MKFTIDCAREGDSRWLAEVSELPGCLAYGTSAEEAMGKTEVLALRVLAEGLEHRKSRPLDVSISILTNRASREPCTNGTSLAGLGRWCRHRALS
jgi:predicted RNase H-like HicB family nuclease